VHAGRHDGGVTRLETAEASAAESVTQNDSVVLPGRHAINRFLQLDGHGLAAHVVQSLRQELDVHRFTGTGHGIAHFAEQDFTGNQFQPHRSHHPFPVPGYPFPRSTRLKACPELAERSRPDTDSSANRNSVKQPGTRTVTSPNSPSFYSPRRTNERSDEDGARRRGRQRYTPQLIMTSTFFRMEAAASATWSTSHSEPRMCG